MPCNGIDVEVVRKAGQNNSPETRRSVHLIGSLWVPETMKHTKLPVTLKVEPVKAPGVKDIANEEAVIGR